MQTPLMQSTHRYGLDPTALLLAQQRLWRLATTCNQIRLDGPSMHAVCLVSYYNQYILFTVLMSCSATASKTNWITLVTGVSHEKLQVFHRWTAYAFFVLALMHTFPFIVFHIQSHDMVMEVTEMSTLFYWTGIVALIFQAWLTFASHSTIR